MHTATKETQLEMLLDERVKKERSSLQQQGTMCTYAGSLSIVRTHTSAVNSE